MVEIVKEDGDLFRGLNYLSVIYRLKADVGCVDIGLVIDCTIILKVYKTLTCVTPDLKFNSAFIEFVSKKLNVHFMESKIVVSSD